MHQRVTIGELTSHVGKNVKVFGWVANRRDQGKMIFLDLRDNSGKVQSICLPANTAALEVASVLRPEWCVAVTGEIKERPSSNAKQEDKNGNIELVIDTLEVLSEAATPPFEVSNDSSKVSEDIRLTYRYLDMRTERMHRNILMRSKVQKFIRDHLGKLDFSEIETPLLTNPTPEGARSYIVPSRVHQHSFYALPQSPQQYKQLLMVGGFDKYFQFARCMRDEDTRGDRQPEFTQLDMELSFVEQEDVLAVNEELLIAIVHKLFPDKKIQQVPFPRLTYKESMDKYGNDRPDLREDKNDPNSLAFCWIVDFPAFEKTGDVNFDDTGEWTFTHNPFTGPKPGHEENLRKKENIAEIISAQHDIVLNGYEIGGGGIRIHDPELQKKVFEIMGYSDDRIEKNFGHLLEALRYGPPPHGGIAWGFDRLMMILLNEPNIREVIPFAKTGEGKDLMVSAPAEVAEGQLKELGINLTKK